MKKHLGAAAVALGLISSAMFALPAQAAALTDTQIQSILTLLQVFGADATTIANTNAALHGQATSGSGDSSNSTAGSASGTAGAPASCSTFANLRRGQTDAKTGGMVTQLQQFLGVSPTTGYYGALSSIGYTNKCGNLGNAQPTSVSGMSKYTDSDFGFSFWYPSGWTVSAKTGTCDSIPVGGTERKCILVGGDTHTNDLVIAEVDSPSMSLEENTVDGANPIGVDEKIFFDPKQGAWMDQNLTTAPNGTPAGTIKPLDVSNNTMGGLHIFGLSPQRHDFESIVPLSATRFLVLDYENGNATISKDSLVSTIVATDPTVAIPVSTAQQIATIQAEANAYGVPAGNPSQSSSLQTYTNSQYGFSVQYDPSSFNTGKPAIMPFMGYPSVPNTLFALYYTGGKNIAGFSAANVTLAASNAVTYEDCTRMLSGSSPAQSTTKQVTVGGRTFYKDSTGDAATGHYSSTDSYRAYYNGACYEIFLKVDTSVTGDGTPIGDTTPVSNALQSVLDSFMFTVPDTTPVLHATALPEWSTFVGQSTPVSFTYPGSFLVYESENESDVGPGVKAGLQTFQSTISPGSIMVQMTPSKYFPSGDSATQAMQASMKTEPIAYPSFTYKTMTLGGEQAYADIADTGKTGSSVIYVAHGNNFFRILLWGPLLPNEYQTFVNSFSFTQ